MGVGRFAFTPLLPLMQKDAGVTISAGAWLAAANYLGYLMGALAALGSGVRASTSIRLALIVAALATLGMGFVHNLPAWIALRWLAGFASAFLLIFISAWSMERVAASPRQATLGALVFSGVGAGIFIVGAACLAMETLHVSSANAWVRLGAPSLVLALLLWPAFGSATTRREAAAKNATPPGAPRLVAAYGLFGFGYIIPATFLPVMAKTAAGADALGIAWPVFGLAAFGSTLLAARVNARPLRVWAHAQLLLIAGVALPLFASSLALVVISGAIVGGTFMVVTMFGMQSAKAFGGANPRRLMAAMTAAFATGQLAGPLVVPYVGADGSFGKVLLLAVGALAVGVFMLPSEKEGPNEALPQ